MYTLFITIIILRFILQDISEVDLEKGIGILEPTDTYNFDASSLQLKRSNSACWLRWHSYLLPILKTYKLGSSTFPTEYFHWKTELYCYISDNRVETAEDIDYQHVMNKVCPGQTLTSLKTLVKCINRYQHSKKNGFKYGFDDRNETFLEKVQRRISSPKSARNRLDETNDKTIKRISRIEEIVTIYKKLIEENE